MNEPGFQFVFYYANQLVLQYQDQIERYVMDNIMTKLQLPIEIPQYEYESGDEDLDRVMFEDECENQNDDIFDYLIKNQLDAENRIYVSTTCNWLFQIKNIGLKKDQVVPNSYDTTLRNRFPSQSEDTYSHQFDEMRTYGDVYVCHMVLPNGDFLGHVLFLIHPSQQSKQWITCDNEESLTDVLTKLS